MLRTVSSLGLILFSLSGLAIGSEADELRAKAKALRKEASTNADRGNKEAAERLERESVELLEAAERIESKGREEEGVDREVRRLKEQLHDLLDKERKMQDGNASEYDLAHVREQIFRIERELQHIHARHSDQHPDVRAQAEKLEIAVRRIHHMRVAAENLKLAEMHDLAHEVMKKADEMERDVHAAKHRLAVEMHETEVHRREEVPEFVRDLRAEIERLRAEVRELSERVEKR